jgi:hypothetical protein
LFSYALLLSDVCQTAVLEERVVKEEERAAKALTDALQAADAALGQVTGWCEAIGWDAARLLGPHGTASRTDPGYLRALAARGRLADAVRKLQGAAEEFRQARNPAPAPRTSSEQEPRP